MKENTESIVRELEATFSFEKETTNTYRFQEDEIKGKLPISGTVYLQKHWFDEKPSRIKVIIKVLEIGETNDKDVPDEEFVL